MLRRSGIRAAVTTAVVSLVACTAPSAAVAQSPDHIAGDPLNVYADGLGRLQFRFVEEADGTFFPPDPKPANAGLEISDDTGHYGLADPRESIAPPTLVSREGRHELTSTYGVGPNLEVTERIVYIDGTQDVDLEYLIKNVSSAPVSFRAGELADLYVDGSDSGRGVFRNGKPRFVGGWSSSGMVVGLVEQTPWAHFEEGDYNAVFDNFESTTLEDWTDPNRVDNGVGAEWLVTGLAPGAVQTISVKWRIGPDLAVNTPADGDDGSCTTAPDGCTLREALTYAADGDMVWVPPDDYRLTTGQELAVATDVTVLGGGADATTIRVDNPEFPSRVLSIQDGADVSLSGVHVTGGAAFRGGGILVEPEAALYLSDAAVEKNSADAGGGISSAGTLELVRTTVAANSALSREVEGIGGGLELRSGVASLENSTVSSNSADGKGGGIYTGISVRLTNVTIADNMAADGAPETGGGLYQAFAGGQQTVAANTLVARNKGGSCGRADAPPIRSSHGLSDEFPNPTCIVEGSGNLVVADVRIGDLLDNGGPTATHAVLAGSPAIDAGNPDSEICPEVDQRGVYRPLRERCDIGAYEYEPVFGLLEVFTNVVNNNGGTAGSSDFIVRVLQNDQDMAQPQPGSEEGTFYDLETGRYRVLANGPTGYTVSISGDCTSDGFVDVRPPEEVATCIITADDIAPPPPPSPPPPATLVVVTQVVNDDGGIKTPGDFTVHVRTGGADVAGSPRAGSASGTSYTLPAGSYAVSADTVTRYTNAVSGDCASDGTITLQPGATKTCTVTGNDVPLPPPVSGKVVNALPASGTVKIKVKGTNKFVELEVGQQIPVGSVIDTTKGRVTIEAAGGQSADFYDGVFRLTQGKGAKPLTTLTLVQALSCPKAGSAVAAAKRKRRLWGDGSGRFRTSGRHSAATVVGTKWLVEDRCTSTLTRVVKGRVSVRDFAKKKTVVVRAGKKYVARARR